MSLAKTQLKAARDYISKKDYINAKRAATQVLDFEPENYNAHVFLALSLSEMGELDESERIYRKATELNPTQPLAWQGISNLYERQKDWDKQATTFIQLLTLFNKSKDAIKLAEVLQKLISLYRNHGTQSQLISGLSYYLPDSEFYPLLLTLPPPDATNPAGSTTFDSQNAIHNGFRILEEVLYLSEKLEDDTFQKELERRRTRLGAPSIPCLYESILNHPNTSDEVRGEVEAKQLRYKQRQLFSIPPSNQTLKCKVYTELKEIVEGIVLLKKPDDLGWKLYFEEQDCEEIPEYGRNYVQQYIRLFPESALASAFKGYFSYRRETLFEGEEDAELYTLTDEDPVDTLLNAFANLPDSVLMARLLGDVYLEEKDYENAIKISKQGLQLLSRLEFDIGKHLCKTRTGFQVILATSLVHFFPPKHHKEATRIVDDILTRSPKNALALMDRAYILQAASSWAEAGAVFVQVSSLLSEHSEIGMRAKEESAWCKCQLGQYEAGGEELHHVLDALNNLEGEEYNSDRARCLWRIGKCNMDIGGTNIQSAYKYFINSLKQDSEFAPAFTSLGIYYLEYSAPPDPIRSSKCFQKAFELDARETIAARRLAEGFANEREWDLVEVVAQRTIDGEGGLNAGLAKAELDASSRYLPTNSWAWKAVGLVKLHYKDYTTAIQSFQIALRVEPEDQPLWVNLGEAYHKAGRHVAALKALNHALQMKPDDWLCSYTIADVKQSLGLFGESIAILEKIRTLRPDEAGVLVKLAQAYLDLGRTEISDGFLIRAEQSFVNAIDVALDMMTRVSGFRTMAWKIIANAAFHLSSFVVYNNEATLCRVLQAIPFIAPRELTEQLDKIVPVPSFQNDVPLNGLQILAVSVHAALSQISLNPGKQINNSCAWYDLGVALQLWVKKSPPSLDVTSAKEKIIEYLKTALQLDASNDMYWVALGNAYFLSHAKAAQHAYIKALEIDTKNPKTWINLGFLYFYHGDVELANEAFYRAQVLDADNTLAWVGQFLVATASGDMAESVLLLEHAVGLPTPVSEGDYEFSSQVFLSAKKLTKNDKFQESLLPAFFLLNRYCATRPQDASGLHLLALVCERLGHLSLGEELVERTIGILETAYEETEDPEVELRYIIANATLGRLKLSQGTYSESATFFESALGLLTEKEAGEGPVRLLKVQAYLGLGLAHFFQDNLEEALGHLENGMAAAGDDLFLRGQVTIVLAQTLWALGTDEAKEIAKARLLECIASDPENLPAINTLAGMGILTNDDGLVDAALSEILALPLDQKHHLDPQRHVDYLLIQHHLAQGATGETMSIAQHSVNAEPGSLDQRNRLASLIVQSRENKGSTSGGQVQKSALALLSAGGLSGDVDAAAVALSIQAVMQASLKEKVDVGNKEGRGDGSGGNGMQRDALRKAQRAIMMRPSEMRGWQTLAYVRARSIS
ncbi:Superkiller protein 3 [Psilocybe cubensis]|uniref:Superkiller protein 3 n=2 Tax=Psilocybe cubensis TaxID=181762 RepID=A0ACB8HC41_PSICU|nr:Superkiller protein 3 [Psilocybe cubensis]KAH9485295.1 Superkiller protein 3 [Psilocybe cubensis]